MTVSRMRTTNWVSIVCSALALSVITLPASAFEGMWLPEQLPELADEMQSHGLELDPVSLADPESPPLRAILSLGGCSASFVSAQGLVITNHHCVAGALQHNSTPEQNLVDLGFVAETREAEVWAGPGARAYITESIVDVTELVLADVTPGMDDSARYDAMDEAKKTLVADCEATPHYRCRVASYFGGAQFRLISSREFEDVRLTYAPPESLASFGGDIDNWMWPRHCDDVSLLRVYVSPDGEPAPFSEENVPYQPDEFLTVSFEGVSEGDFVMVAGYPWSTSRHRTANEMAFVESTIAPWEVMVMHDLLGLLEGIQAEDPSAEVALRPFMEGLANYLKYNEGLLDSFAASNVTARMLEVDAGLRAWIQGQGEAMSGWGESIAELDAQVEAERATGLRDTVLDWTLWSVDLLSSAATIHMLSVQREFDDMERLSSFQERNWDRIRDRFDRLSESYVEAADRAVLVYFLRMAHELPDGQRIRPVDTLLAEHGGDVEAAVDALFETTVLGDADTRLAMLDYTREQVEASDDPFIRFAVDLYALRMAIINTSETRSGALDRLRPDYIEALQAFSPGPLYPDANGTLRVTFGNVEGVEGADAIWYRPFTSLRGLVEKHTGEEPFNAPEALLEAIASGDYAGYARASVDSVPVNFLSTLDTTGGNSGSASLNATGELVGLLFDGTYESMSADFVFNPVNTRSIHVDIRYILWVMDRVFPAHHLLREMGITPAFE